MLVSDNIKFTKTITAIPELLELLDISGCLVTIDAMGCQKKTAQKILNKNADYLLAVRGNQGLLARAFDSYFDMSMLQKHDGDSYSTQEKSRGRQQTRLALTNTKWSVLGDLAYDWPKLKNGYRCFCETRRSRGQRVRHHGEILH